MKVPFNNHYTYMALIISAMGLQASRDIYIGQSAQSISFFKRQVTDLNGRMIDLNKEPSPEPISQDTAEGTKFASLELARKMRPSTKANVKRVYRKNAGPPVSLYGSHCHIVDSIP